MSRTRSWLGAALPWGVLSAGAFALPSVVEGRTLHLLTTTLIYGMFALSLRLLYGFGGQLSVAHGAFWGVGAYASVIGFDRYDIPVLGSFGIALIVGGLVAFLVGVPSLRVSGHYFLIVTFAAAEVMRLVLVNTRSFTGGSTGKSVVGRPPDFLGLDFTQRSSWYFLLLAVFIAATVAIERLAKSGFGRRLVAIRESELLARSVGVDIARTKLLAFAVSGAMAGTVGALSAYFQRFIDPEQFGASAGIDIIVVLILGGSRHVLGPIVGAAFFIFLPEMLGLTPTQNDLLLGAVLIGVILLMPQGFTGAVQGIFTGARRLAERRRRAGGAVGERSVDRDSHDMATAPVRRIDG